MVLTTSWCRKSSFWLFGEKHIECVANYAYRTSALRSIGGFVDFPIGDGIHAFGKMKLPNLTSSFAYLSILPITYLFLKMGATPITSYMVACFAYPLALACDLWILNKYSGFNVRYYLQNVPLKTIALMLLASILPAIIANEMEEGWLNFIVTSSLCCLSSALLVFFIGFDSVMRKKVVLKVKLCIDNLHYKMPFLRFNK